MLKPNRSGFKLHLAASDAQLWAIGMVVVQWGHIEAWAQVFIDQMSQGNPKPQKPPPFRKRLDQWRALVEAQILNPWRNDLLAIIDDISNAEIHRDKIVHGQWGKDNVERTEVFHWSVGKRSFNWKLDFEGIKRVALQLDDINTRLFQFMMRIANAPHGTVGSALPRISRKPNQTP